MLSTPHRLHVAGDGAAVVVQPPAWGPPADYLRLTLAPLLAGYRVVTYDARNTGDAPRQPEGEHRLADLLADLDAAVAAAGGAPVALVGHSHGARTAAAYALERPARVRRLVLLTPSRSGGGPDPAAADLLARWANDPERADAVRALRTGPGATPDGRALARWVRRCMPTHFADLDHMRAFGRALRRAAPPSASAYRGIARDPGADPYQRAGRIRTPTLLVSGAHDPLAPPARVEELARRIPGARHAVLEASGHYPWFEEPGPFRTVVTEFLDGP